VRVSLKVKAILMITFCVLFIGVVAAWIWWRGSTRMVQEQYIQRAEALAKSVEVIIDPEDVRVVRDATLQIYHASSFYVSNDNWETPEFEEYVSQFSSVEELPEFIRLQEKLREVDEANGVDCICIFHADLDRICQVYLVDSAIGDENCPPGTYDMLYEDDMVVIDDPEGGFPPMITNTEEYGWLLTRCMPIHDSAGKILAYAEVDLSMDEIMQERNSYLFRGLIVLLILELFVCVIAVILLERFVAGPIRTLSDAARSYSSSEITGNSVIFSEIRARFHAKDEIEVLAESMTRMEGEINRYVAHLIETTNELSTAREHEEELDRIANIDALTRVRNKRAYDQETKRIDEDIKNGDAAFGIAMVDLNNLKKLNDSFGHEKGDLAIQNLCAIICRIFQHSPVFRVGGDEFAIIVENTDHENVQELIEMFKAEIKDLSESSDLTAWERVSAAIGYTEFEKEQDQSVEDVFSRADTLMYENKRIMKSGNK
jgi:diguanylate cyclase (GGDEF)-like protein